MIELFGAYYRLGNALINSGASLTFKHHMRTLNNVAHDQIALVSKIGLCRGLSARNGDTIDAKITLDHRVIDCFLFKRNMLDTIDAKITLDHRVIDRFLFKRDMLVHEKDDGFDHTHSSDLEAIAGYAIDAKLKRFVIDGPRASEYQIDYSVEPPGLRNTGCRVTSTIDRKGRPRIKLPFRPFGQIICTQPERVNGISGVWTC